MRPHVDPGPVKGCWCGWCVELRRHVKVLQLGQHDASRPKVVNRNGPRVTHGRRLAYSRGCRCPGCKWSATKLGQAMARCGVDTTEWWERWAGPGEYPEVRRRVDEASIGFVRRLLVVLGAADAWTAPMPLTRPRRRHRPLAPCRPAGLKPG